MKKNKDKSTNGCTFNSAIDIGRGKIKDNFLSAIVTSKVYKLQVVKAKKGKGSYRRTTKHKGQEPYLIAA